MNNPADGDPVARSVDDAIHAIVQPLEEQLNVIEEALRTKRKELASLARQRERLLDVLKVVEPKQRSKVASQAKQDALARWLREREPTLIDGFSAADLMKRSDFDLMSRHTLSWALRGLEEDSVIEFERTTSGGGRVYRMA